MSRLDRSRSGTATLRDVALVGVFLGILALPLVDRLVEIDPAPPIIENRQPAPRPAFPDGWLALGELPGAFERYWNDSFGFRRTFVRAYNRTLVAFRTSPLPERVTVGSDGWLFYSAEGVLDDYRGERPFGQSELIRWQYLLENRRDWLKDRGIPYVFFIAPNKETIYPDYMPRRIPRGTTHRLDQLLAFLAAYSDFEIVDPRSLLASAAASEDMYLRTDSHWSARGAWLVTEEILERLAGTPSAMKRSLPTDLLAVPGTTSGDLASMLGLSGLLSESMTSLVLASPRAQRSGTPTNVSSWTTVDDPSLPRAVFFHDSFGDRQRLFFAEHFSSLRCVWIGQMDPEIVEAEGPQLVLHEMAERFLGRPPPNDSMVLSDNSRVRAAFGDSADILLRIPGDAAATTPLPPLTVEAPPDGTMTLHVQNGPASLLLPEMRHRGGSFPVLRLQIESPVDARLVVFYQTTAEPTYEEQRRAWWPLHAGANLAWLIFPDPELTGRLRLDLTASGDYRLTALEARAVPRAARRR